MLDRTTKLQTYQTYLDGRWADAASGKTFQTFDPYTGAPWALIPECDKADVDTAVEAAYRAFESGPWSKDDAYRARQDHAPDRGTHRATRRTPRRS